MYYEGWKKMKENEDNKRRYTMPAKKDFGDVKTAVINAAVDCK